MSKQIEKLANGPDGSLNWFATNNEAKIRAYLRAQADTLSDTRDYDWLVIQFRIGQIEALVAWLDICATTVISAPA